jgi:hypothetical protein
VVSPLCEEVVDSTGDTMVNTGSRRLDITLVVLVSGGGKPLPGVVLVVVGGGVVCEIVVGNRGTTGWLTEDLLEWITKRTHK